MDPGESLIRYISRVHGRKSTKEGSAVATPEFGLAASTLSSLYLVTSRAISRGIFCADLGGT